MRKQVSPVFALIVIVIAIVLGALWFMAQERKFQIEEQRQSEALQRQRDMAIRSGRARGGGIQGSRRRSQQPGTREGTVPLGQPSAPSEDKPEAAETP